MQHHRIKDTIHHFRQLKGLTQKALSNISGVPQYHFTNINNDDEVEEHLLIRISNALSLELDELLKMPIETDINTLKGDLLCNQFPQLIKHIDKSKNTDIKIEELLSSSSTELYWTCTTCSDSFKRSVAYYTKTVNSKKSGQCLSCSRSAMKGFSSLSIEHPEISCEFDKVKNTRDIEDVGIYSTRMLFWRCKVCDHSWLDSPYRRLHSSKSKGCPACESETLHNKALETIKYYNGELLKVVNNIFHLKCSSGHKFTVKRSGLLDYDWCSTCRERSRTGLASNNTPLHTEFKHALEGQGFTLLDDKIKGLTKEHQCLCPEGHETPITPKKAIKSASSDKAIECYTCKKSGKYRKQYYKNANEIIRAVVTLNIHSTSDFRKRFKEDPKLCVRQLTDFPELKKHFSNLVLGTPPNTNENT